jgi:glycerol transport system ATP-binding protein
VTPHGSGPGTVELEGNVLVTELSGSESVVHFDLDGQAWISQSHGIHPFEIGATARFYMEIGKSKLFDLDDRLVAA